MSVSSEPGTVVTSSTQVHLDAGWTASIIEGTISPQPNWEDFTFSFSSGGVYVDEAYIGTHCVPEPATIGLLLAGILVVVHRRR